jgi:hypothetical protein
MSSGGIPASCVSPKNDPDVDKEKRKSFSAHRTIGGRPVSICQLDAHSQEIVPVFNDHFSVVYWPGDYTDHCITFYEFINPSLLISTKSVPFVCTDFFTTLYFVNQRNYKTLAMLAHALTCTRYFCSLNVIISHLIVYKEGLGYLSACAIASRSSPPTHVFICNGHPGSDLCCVNLCTP